MVNHITVTKITSIVQHFPQRAEHWSTRVRFHIHPPHVLFLKKLRILKKKAFQCQKNQEIFQSLHFFFTSFLFQIRKNQAKYA